MARTQFPHVRVPAPRTTVYMHTRKIGVLVVGYPGFRPVLTTKHSRPFEKSVVRTASLSAQSNERNPAGSTTVEYPCFDDTQKKKHIPG